LSDERSGLLECQRQHVVLGVLASGGDAAERARTDVNAFAELFKDEQGRQLVQAPFHRDLQSYFGGVQAGILQAPPATGKSIQLAIRALWEIGRNPSIRIGIVSSTIDLGKKLLDVMKNNIEFNEDLHRVFPHLSKHRFEMWDKERIQFSGYRGTKKDYTVEVAGVGKHIYGSRFDLAILDDIMDINNSAPPGPAKILDWHDTTLISRLTRGDREWIIGTPWNKYDFYHVMEEREVPSRKYLIEDSPDHTGGGVFLWPAQWDAERLAARKKKMASWRFYQQYYMQDASPDTSPFVLDSLRRCYVDADRFRDVKAVPSGYQFITGMDLGIKKKRTSDLTTLVTIATDGTKKVIVDVRAGKWGLGEKKQMVEAVHRLYGGIFIVEDVGAQMLMIEMLKDHTRVPVVPVTTTHGTKISEEFGIPAMAIDIENGRWEIPALPSAPLEIRELVDELILYNPQAHSGDRLMAMYFAYAGVDMIYGGARVQVRGTLRREPE